MEVGMLNGNGRTAQRIKNFAQSNPQQLLLEVDPRPTFCLDSVGHILATNCPAERLLQAHLERLRAEDGYLRLSPHASQMALRQGLSLLHSKLLTQGSRTSAPVRMALWLPGCRIEPDLLCRLALLQLPHSGPMALLTLLSPSLPADGLALAAELFGLTPAETRVAAGLAEGHDIPWICTQLGIRLTTARTHLKSLYAKTRTHRQGELIALLVRLAAV